MRCSAARSLLTSDSKSFTLSVRTWDLADNSRNCESLRASCSLHIERARCDISRSRLAGVRAGPELLFWVLVLLFEGAGTAETGGRYTGLDTIAGGGVLGTCCRRCCC